MLVQPNLDANAREKAVKISTNKIKIPVRLIRFLLCFLLLNERFKGGVVPSFNILESLKNSSIVCFGSMAVIGDVLWEDFVPKVWLEVLWIDIGTILDRGILFSIFLERNFFSHISGKLTKIMIMQMVVRIQSFLKWKNILCANVLSLYLFKKFKKKSLVNSKTSI